MKTLPVRTLRPCAFRAALLLTSVATASGCGPPPEDGASQIEIAEAAHQTEPSTTIKTPTDKMFEFLKDAENTANKAMDALGVVAEIPGYVKTGTKLLELVGVLPEKDPNAAFNELKGEIYRYTEVSDWKDTERDISTHLSDASSAIFDARSAREAGVSVFESDVKSRGAFMQLTRPVLALRTNTLNPATCGVYKWGCPPRDAHMQSYDWRMIVPALVDGMALRLRVMAMYNPDFDKSDAMRGELMAERRALEIHYARMVAGLSCITMDQFLTYRWDGDSDNLIPVYSHKAVRCGDLYSGQASEIDLGSRSDNEVVVPADEVAAAERQMYAQVARAMPFLQLRAMIDSIGALAGLGYPSGLKEGMLVKEMTDSRVYSLIGGNKVLVRFRSSLDALGGCSGVRVVPDGTLAGIADGIPNGSVVQEDANPAVFVVADGKSIWVRGPEVMEAVAGWGALRRVPAGSLPGRTLAFPGGAPPSPSDLCPMDAANLPTFPDGLWVSNLGGAVYSLRGATACWVTFPQWLALGRPVAQSLGAYSSAFESKFGRSFCTNQALGLWPNGYYQAKDGAVWRLRGDRACWVTYVQWVSLGQPGHLLRWLGTDSDRFTSSMASGAFCTDAEIAQPL